MFGFRSHDDVTAGERVFKSLAALYKDEPQKVPLKMTLSLSEDAPSVLSVSDGENQVSASAAPCRKALKTPPSFCRASAACFPNGGGKA